MGWMVGVSVEIPLLPVLSFQPALLLNSKGGKLTLGDNSGDNYTELKIKPTYLELPLNLVIKAPLPNKVKLFAGAGPYAAVGLGGKSSTEGKLAGTTFSTESKIGYGDNSTEIVALKRLDIGVNILAGIEISHLTMSANYGYGLSDIRAGTTNDDAKYQNRAFTLAVGFLF